MALCMEGGRRGGGDRTGNLSPSWKAPDMISPVHGLFVSLFVVCPSTRMGVQGHCLLCAECGTGHTGLLLNDH